MSVPGIRSVYLGPGARVEGSCALTGWERTARLTNATIGILRLESIALLGAAALTACAQTPQPSRFEYRQRHMGTEVRIVFFAADSSDADPAARTAFDRIAELEQTLSDYLQHSEVSRLCDRAGGPPVPVSPDLFTLIRRSVQLARETSGAFDITVGPLTLLWRKARQSGVPPDSAELADAGRRVGWTHITLDTVAQTVRLALPGMRLDFGGIGKGYAADQALATLNAHGIEHAMVALGGDIVTGLAPPGEPGWRITIENADSANRHQLLHNASISTSGDTEQFLESSGVRHSHVIDPRTGRPQTHRTSVTVIARRGVDADAFATAASVLSPQARQAFVDAHPDAAFYIRRIDCNATTAC